MRDYAFRIVNVFAESPDSIDGSGKAPDRPNPDEQLAGNFRRMYHKGFGSDDVDRYGPAIELVKDLHRRIEQAQLAGVR